MVKISIIIVNYNSIELLKNCLALYINESLNDFEIIVFDNNSKKDFDSDYFNQKYENIFIINSVNLGFSRANNLAAKYSNGEFLFFLTPIPTLIILVFIILFLVIIS